MLWTAKKNIYIYKSIDRQLKTLVNTYDNSNKISFLDNIAKILTFYLLLKTHYVTFFLMYLFVYVLLFRLQKVSIFANILYLNIRKRFQFALYIMLKYNINMYCSNYIL